MGTDTLRYNHVRQKSSHNAFQRHEGIFDQALYWRVRSFEVDVHDTKIGRVPATGDWFVYHETLDWDTTVDTLSGFLQIMWSIHQAIPNHEVITLFIDLNRAFGRTARARHSVARFDALFDDYLGRALLRPDELQGSHATLRDAVAGPSGAWPTLDSLRGRFIVVLTGKESRVDQYWRTRRGDGRRSCFASKTIRSERDFRDQPSHVVFYNFPALRLHFAERVNDAGLVGRGYYIDSAESWKAAKTLRCHHIATDVINSRRSPWARTDSPATGAPFQALEPGPAPRPEPAPVAAIWADTDDVWGRSDNCRLFFIKRTAADADQSYHLWVAGPNSHVADFTKGFVMARESLHHDAAYFGVFRTGEKNPLRVQIRPVRGARAFRLDLVSTGIEFDPDTHPVMKLVVSDGGRRVRGFGSPTGRAGSWTDVHEMTFEEPLLIHGIGVSSHRTARGSKFLFGDVRGRALPFVHHRSIGPSGASPGWVDVRGDRRWRLNQFGGG